LLISSFFISGCGENNATQVRPQDGRSSLNPAWIVFQIQEVTPLVDRSDGLDGLAEMQIISIITDGHSSSKNIYPSEGAVQIGVGTPVNMGKYAIAVDENAIGNELLIYLLAVDSDELSANESLLIDIGSEFIQAAITVIASMGGINAIGALTLDMLLNKASDRLLAWAEQSEVIGQDTLILQRSDNWDIGAARTRTSADNGMRILYQVSRNDEPPQLNIPNFFTGCGNWYSHLETGTDAYVTNPVPLYNAARYQNSPDKGKYVEQLTLLQPGDRVKLLPDSDSPKCYHRSYFWFVETEGGQNGYVYEYYRPHVDDQLPVQPAETYYLSPTPP
jgi:hypothetical protein